MMNERKRKSGKCETYAPIMLMTMSLGVADCSQTSQLRCLRQNTARNFKFRWFIIPTGTLPRHRECIHLRVENQTRWNCDTLEKFNIRTLEQFSGFLHDALNFISKISIFQLLELFVLPPFPGFQVAISFKSDVCCLALKKVRWVVVFGMKIALLRVHAFKVLM